MRTYAQDTALPGGKYEEGDIDAEGTAVSLIMDPVLDPLGLRWIGLMG